MGPFASPAFNKALFKALEETGQTDNLMYDRASFAPITGEIISAKEAKEFYDQGDYGMMALASLGAIPLVGTVARPAIGLMKKGGKAVKQTPEMVKRGGRVVMETPMMSSAKNVINQTVSNMPTTIKGFYTGKPIRSFVRDFVGEIPSALKTRTDAVSRAFQDTWGISKVKVDDILGQGRVARKESAPLYRDADILDEAGLSKEADKLRREGNRLATKTGQDAEFTAMAIEAQMSPNIIPVEQRGAFANSVYGLNYFSRGIDRADTSKLTAEIGNAHRLEGTGEIPEDITGFFVNHLVSGPHVKRTDDLYEYQVKTLDASRGAGLTESEGYGGAGAMLARAFNTGSKKSTVPTSFDSYRKLMKDLVGRNELSKKDSIEFLQLAATMTTDAANKLNKAMPSSSNMGAKQLLDSIVTARALLREGKKITKSQQARLTAFETLVKQDKIKLAKVTDSNGTPVGGLDYNNIKEPEGIIKTQTTFHSKQKELGGVNQMVVMDVDNKTNYSMISDGHDIFDEPPLNGHHLITAQPITKRGWDDVGFSTQHTGRADFDKIEAALNETVKRVGTKLPDNLNRANFDNADDYYKAAEDFTDELMQQSVKPTQTQIAAANRSQQKLSTAQTGGMLLGAYGINEIADAFTDDE